jgi:hypothetical protein
LGRLDVALHDGTEDGGAPFIKHFWHSMVPTARQWRR